MQSMTSGALTYPATLLQCPSKSSAFARDARRQCTHDGTWRSVAPARQMPPVPSSRIRISTVVRAPASVSSRSLMDSCNAEDLLLSVIDCSLQVMHGFCTLAACAVKVPHGPTHYRSWPSEACSLSGDAKRC